jgi:hypothetical protein
MLHILSDTIWCGWNTSICLSILCTSRVSPLATIQWHVNNNLGKVQALNSVNPCAWRFANVVWQGRQRPKCQANYSGTIIDVTLIALILAFIDRKLVQREGGKFCLSVGITQLVHKLTKNYSSIFIQINGWKYPIKSCVDYRLKLESNMYIYSCLPKCVCWNAISNNHKNIVLQF